VDQVERYLDDIGIASACCERNDRFKTGLDGGAKKKRRAEKPQDARNRVAQTRNTCSTTDR